MATLLPVLFLCLATLLTTPLVTQAAAGSANPDYDVRVLIDVSGSMKENDPNNLRIPALRLLVGLLPPDTKAGVSTFGTTVSSIVPAQAVNQQWKEQALAHVEQVHSRSLFTDIEAALNQALDDWQKPDADSQRSLILLTDGFVDVSKNPLLSSASRSRILNEQLLRLKQLGITVHTIALSANADQALLRQLATATNGWYEEADTSEKLERIFLRMLEKSTKPNTLPITDNMVKIDKSINEITLLIFRNDDSSETRINPPSRSGFIFDKHPRNVKWHREDHYDLVTIDKPNAGVWYIEADMDPDNRVMVVTDLKLAATRLPNNLIANERYPFSVELLQDNKPVSNPDFLKFVVIKLSQNADGQEQHVWYPADDGDNSDLQAKDGVYSLELSDTLTEGTYEFITMVDGTTFQREDRQLVNVYTSPVATRLDDSGDNLHYQLSVIPRAGMIDADSMIVKAIIKDSAGEEQELAVPRMSVAEWHSQIDVSDQPGMHTLALNVVGRRPDGKPVSYWSEPVSIGREPVIDPEPQETVPHTESTEPEQPVTRSPDNHVESAEPDWLMVGIEMTVLNVLVIVAVFFMLRAIKQRQVNWETNLRSALAHD
jgi:uncharacterized protein (TIGR03503 family)